MKLIENGKWGTAIVAKHKIVKEICLNNAYPGSTGLIVADIKIADNLVLTAINIYGLIDADSYASCKGRYSHRQ